MISELVREGVHKVNRENLERTEQCYLALSYHADVNEQCLLGVIGGVGEEYSVESRQINCGMTRLMVRLSERAFPQDAIRYLSCMDGVKQVLLVSEIGKTALCSPQ